MSVPGPETFRPRLLLAPIFLCCLMGMATAALCEDELDVPDVARIQFDGNETFGRRTLLRWMTLQPAGRLRKLEYDPVVLAEDLERLCRFYQQEGFFDVRARGLVDSLTTDHGERDLYVTIEEGSRWRMGEVALEWSRPDSEEPVSSDLVEAVRSRVDAEEGGAFRARFLPRWVRGIREELVESGYLDADVRLHVRERNQRRMIDVRFEITPGAPSVVRDVEVVGGEGTRPVVIHRELTFSPGDALLPSKLRQSEDVLNRHGYFERVALHAARADSGRAEKAVVVDIGNRRRGDMGFDVGYSSADRWLVGARMEHPSLAGTGIRGSIDGIYALQRHGASIGVVTPWTLGTRIGTRLSASYYLETPKNYDAQRISGEVSFSRSWVMWKTELGYVLQQVKLIDAASGNPGPENTRLGSIGLSLSRDSRPDLLGPLLGSFWRGSAEMFSPWLGADDYFSRAKGQVRFRYAVVPRIRLGWRLFGGTIQSQESGRDIPIAERFFLGGTESVRGFPGDGIGPADSLGVAQGGRILFHGSIEADFDIVRPVGAALFVDAGQLQNHQSNFIWENNSVSAGFGLRVWSPFGSVRLDLGFPLTEPFAEDPFRVHFSTGTTFF